MKAQDFADTEPATQEVPRLQKVGAYGLIDENGSRANQYEWDSMQKNNVLTAYLNRYLVLKQTPEEDEVKKFKTFIHPIIDDLLED